MGKSYLKFSFSWNKNFRKDWKNRYKQAQKNVDSEVLRLSEKYIPVQTGMLVKSGILGTDIGSGTVQWIAPYARKQYYSPRTPGSETGPLRGPFWFRRMKATNKNKIVKVAKDTISGKIGSVKISSKYLPKK